jgi:hypothetical protein
MWIEYYPGCVVVKRDLYLDKIRPFIDKPLVKVLTGIRRCGKSTILELLAKEFGFRGIKPECIIYLNFENLDFIDIDSAKKLDAYIKERLVLKTRYYVLLDEVQEVKEWERAVNSLLASTNCDIYITGSNSHLLSSELSTFLTGRYVEININTLSFSEYLKFREIGTGKEPLDLHKEIQRYIRTGGFPVIHLADYPFETIYKIVLDIYNSVILRDTVERHGIRNIEMLERVTRFVFNNIGNTFSAKKIADYFKSQQRKVDLNTIYNYLNALESSFIIRKIPRYDVQGKMILQTNEKYFIGDHSLLYAVMGFRDRQISGVLENIVMMELIGRGWNLFVGKIDDREIDFIAQRENEKIYVQVAYKMSDSKEVISREFDPLLRVKDHYPKYVVTMDDFFQDTIEGVRHVHLADFLLMERY